MSEITLYDLPGCPFCEKVKNKLEALDVEYETVEVPGARPERNEVEAVSGQRKVPVIIDEDHDVDGMNESDDIVVYLEETYG